MKERKEGRKKAMESGKKERTISTSETISLERKAIGKLQIPLRPSFSLDARTFIKALRKYAYNIQRMRTRNTVANVHAITELLRVRGAYVFLN